MKYKKNTCKEQQITYTDILLNNICKTNIASKTSIIKVIAIFLLNGYCLYKVYAQIKV